MSIRVLFLRGLPVRADFNFGSMMINTIAPDSQGRLAASRPATALAIGPSVLGLPWRAEREVAILPLTYTARRDCIFTRLKVPFFNVL